MTEDEKLAAIDPAIHHVFGALVGMYMRLVGEPAIRMMFDGIVEMVKGADHPRAEAALEELAEAIKPRAKG